MRKWSLFCSASLRALHRSRHHLNHTDSSTLSSSSHWAFSFPIWWSEFYTITFSWAQEALSCCQITISGLVSGHRLSSDLFLLKMASELCQEKTATTQSKSTQNFLMTHTRNACVTSRPNTIRKRAHLSSQSINRLIISISLLHENNVKKKWMWMNEVWKLHSERILLKYYLINALVIKMKIDNEKLIESH